MSLTFYFQKQKARHAVEAADLSYDGSRLGLYR